MANRSRPTIRRLTAEPLEARRLLAAEGVACERMPSPDVSDAWIGSVAVSTAESDVRAADAGSTRATAADIGNVDGTTRLSGTLGWFDRVDTIKFSVQRDAELQVMLYGMSRNVDLYLTDEVGNLIAGSTRFGRSAELISTSLDAGTYYLSAVARSYLPTGFSLLLSAELQPEPEPEPDPPATGPQPLTDVPYFGGGREWNLNAIGAPESWAAGYTGQGVTVAVIDTGVDLDHPDLVGSLYVNAGEIPGNGIDDDLNGYVDDLHGYDFADQDADPNDLSGHGTHVAGTIAAANNGVGATGVAPGANILPVRVLGADGSGSSLDVAAGIRYAADLGAQIINLSLGGGYSRAIASAIDYAQSLGSLIVAAAGNESAAAPSYPARFSSTEDSVISVGAYNSSGQIAGFSNHVGASGAVQVDAPGVGVFSTYVGGGYATLSGTSMAAPHVAGLAALTLSSNPDLTSRELRDLLANSTQGHAVGSDAVGRVSATTTVAYAAAGFVETNIAAASSTVSRSVVSNFSNNRIRFTSIVAPGLSTDRANGRPDADGHRASESVRGIYDVGPIVVSVSDRTTDAFMTRTNGSVNEVDLTPQDVRGEDYEIDDILQLLG